MAIELARRFANNPILVSADVTPSRPDFVVECLLTPGVFTFEGKIGLLIRVCERPAQEAGWVTLPIFDPAEPTGIRIFRFRRDDPKLVATDPRLITYDGEMLLTTLSHLRLAWSDDGINFKAEPKPTLVGHGPLESYGIEDARVSFLEGQYMITYSAVSQSGVGVGLVTTRNWEQFTHHGMIISPANKDAAIFEQRINGQYMMLHRPSGVNIGGNFIWLAQSPDLLHWGEHQCIMFPRKGRWDSERIGAGAAPIPTAKGLLEIYHGADDKSCYSLGAMLLDGENPARVLARSDTPILKPEADCEKTGFFGNVVFTNGHIVRGDALTMYYGAADSVICGAEFSIEQILASLPK